MKKKATLTNQKLSELFSDNFELAIYAIRKAKRIIHEGGETTMAEILEEVLSHPPERGVRKDFLEGKERPSISDTFEDF